MPSGEAEFPYPYMMHAPVMFLCDIAITGGKWRATFDVNTGCGLSQDFITALQNMLETLELPKRWRVESVAYLDRLHRGIKRTGGCLDNMAREAGVERSFEVRRLGWNHWRSLVVAAYEQKIINGWDPSRH